MSENDPHSPPSSPYVRVPPRGDMMSENDPHSRPSLYVRVPAIGPGDRVAREAAYQVPPDLLADARRGRNMLLGVLGVLLLVQLSVSALYMSRLGLRRIDSQVISLMISAWIGVMLYRGHAWARRTLVVLLGISGFGGAVSSVSLIDLPGAALGMFLLGAVFLACASVLQFSARIRDFMMVQRTRR